MAHKEPIRVLVADDSAVYRKLVEHGLPSTLFTVLPAKCGLEAIELFHQHRPEMVITDWVMPDITGIELCRRIRATSDGSYTYVIILTSVSENRKRGERARCWRR
jgi:CheY-like chemotaxis protein